MNAALPARQGQLAAASERADAQLAEVKRLEIRFRLMVIVIMMILMMMMMILMIVMMIAYSIGCFEWIFGSLELHCG